MTVRLQASERQTRRNVTVSSDDVLMMEMTLAAVMSVFDLDKFNSCLQQLLDDVVQYNHYMLITTFDNSSNIINV